MATRYHVNPVTGEYGVCRAEKGKCPFGGATGDENHYATEEEARRASEAIHERMSMKSTLSKSAMPSALSGALHEGATVFRNGPDGKRAIGSLRDSVDKALDELSWARTSRGDEMRESIHTALQEALNERAQEKRQLKKEQWHYQDIINERGPIRIGWAGRRQ